MQTFLEFALIGFLAQLIDGVLGMGFGVISSAVLLAQGVPPPLVSASVNAAKLPTSGTAAISHWMHGNVDWRLVRALAVYGSLGGICGAVLLTGLKGPWLNMLINAYLLAIGALVLWRGIMGVAPALIAGGRFRLIGLAGGTIEGIGGSWGPVVTTGLLGSGVAPRHAIGSSNFSEFIVSFSVFATLALGYHAGFWGSEGDLSGILASVAGLVAGGLPAALAGGWLASRAPRRPLTVAVGLLAFGIGVWRTAQMF